jgi:DNA polymerase-3 subunit beta
MTTQISRSALTDALRALRPVVAGNPTLPVLANVALDASDGILTLTVTNLEQYAQRRVAYTGDPLPPTTAPAKAFTDFVGAFTGDSVQLTLDHTRLRLQAGRQKASLATVDRGEFPEFPTIPDEEGFTLTRGEFESIGARVAPFAASDTTRPILTGIQVQGDGTRIRFAAADNYRIGVLSIDHQAKVDAVIPASAFTLAGKVLEGEGVTFEITNNVLRLSSDFGVLTTRLIDGQFPNLEGVMPVDFKANVLLVRDEYAQASKLAALATTIVVRFTETDEGLRVQASEYDRDFDTLLDATIGGREGNAPSVQFALASKYVTAIAAAFGDSTELEVGYTSPLAPVSFRDPEDASFRAVVMPVRTPSA